MKIYVDELPKNCKECPLYRSGKLKIQKNGRYIDADTCVLGNYYKFQEMDDEIDTCQLQSTQSLKDQIVKDIKNRLAAKRIKVQNEFHCYPQSVVFWEDIVYILDKVKGENNGKINP